MSDAQIVRRVIDSETDQAVRFNTGIYKRTFDESVGGRWQNLLLGVRFSIDGSVTLPFPRLNFGVCSYANTANYDTINHFYGMMISTSASLLVDNVAGASNYHSASFLYSHARIQNGSLTTNSFSGSNQTYFVRGTTRKGIIYLRMSKSGTAYNSEMGVFDADAANQQNVKLEEFWSGMCMNALDTITSWKSGFQRHTTATSLTIDEPTYGELNTICLMADFNRAQSVKIEISDLAYRMIN